ncbi:hypothetical protein ACP70R_023893 [Stipagrostis hirtigluma subsp. patula]
MDLLSYHDLFVSSLLMSSSLCLSVARVPSLFALFAATASASREEPTNNDESTTKCRRRLDKALNVCGTNAALLAVLDEDHLALKMHLGTASCRRLQRWPYGLVGRLAACSSLVGRRRQDERHRETSRFATQAGMPPANTAKEKGGNIRRRTSSLGIRDASIGIQGKFLHHHADMDQNHLNTSPRHQNQS